jgi:glutamate-ammonia-ligase adenylyltransferase
MALQRLGEGVPGLAAELASDPLLCDALISIVVASRSLTEAMMNDPSLIDVLRDHEQLAVESDAMAYRDRMHAAPTGTDHDEALRALRRSKRAELLRIAARDLVGSADLPTVGRELAALADACLRTALDIAAPDVPVAIIGMGKLGGRELNYSSDVDVLFVHEGDNAEGERAARAVLTAMTRPMPDGIVFRTDADLRPEGRDGRLSRSLDSFAAYYEKWAEPWEFQALLKARAVAGENALGERFLELVEPHVWPAVLDPGAVRQIRAMKGRQEGEMRRRGLDEREIKRGRGGIRDIEFAVQLLQLVHGRSDHSIRSPNTLEALGQLARAGYVAGHDAEQLDDAYRFLRTVEHRLQLQAEQQVHALPADPTTRTRLARVLGYRDQLGASALERFDADARRRQATVRAIHEKLFFGPLLEALAGTGPLPVEAAEERLAAFGFVDAERLRDGLRELTSGLTRRSRLMQQLVPLLFEWLSATPDPDLGLLQLRILTEGPARSAALATTFRESPGAAERVCKLVGSSRVAGQGLRRHPEFIATLGDDTELGKERTREELVERALENLSWRSDVIARREGLRRFKRREVLRIVARDLLGFAPVDTVERELAALADACLEAAVRALAPAVPFAVIGLGKLGGREMAYSSDLDVLFAYEGTRATHFDAAAHAAEQMLREIGAITPEGRTFRIDPNLRPEGKQGPLARSLDGYRQYYEQYALAWEFQALLKARPVAGDAGLGERFLALAEPFVYRDPLPVAAVREVRRMKARVERERIPPGEDPQFHLKLGRGSLSDVEWTVQLLQLQHGARDPDVRSVNTRDALTRVTRAGLLTAADCETLDRSYVFCARARNARYLLSGAPNDSLPTDGAEAEKLAQLLGYTSRPVTSMRDDYRRITRQAREVVERVFYERG